MDDLHKLLEKEGLALSVGLLGAISDQTMAGSFAVGTLGAGAKFRVYLHYIT